MGMDGDGGCKWKGPIWWGWGWGMIHVLGGLIRNILCKAMYSCVCGLPRPWPSLPGAGGMGLVAWGGWQYQVEGQANNVLEGSDYDDSSYDDSDYDESHQGQVK